MCGNQRRVGQESARPQLQRARSAPQLSRRGRVGLGAAGSEEERGTDKVRKRLYDGLARSWAAFQEACDRTETAKALVAKALHRHGMTLSKATDALAEDREFVLDAVKRGAAALQYAVRTIRNERAVGLEALLQSWASFERRSEALGAEARLLIRAFEEHRVELQNAVQELLRVFGREVRAARTPIRKDEQERADVAQALRHKTDLVREAVHHDALAAGLLAQTIKPTKRFVLEATGQSWEAVEYMREQLRGDRAIIEEAARRFWPEPVNALELGQARVSKVRESLEYFDKIREEVDQLCASVEPFGGAMAVVWSPLVALEEHIRTPEAGAFMVEAAKLDGTVLRVAAAHFREDKRVVLEAVRSWWQMLEVASLPLRADWDVVLEAVHRDAGALRFTAEGLRRDRRFMLRAVQRNGQALQWASESVRRDMDVVRMAVQDAGIALQWAAPPLQANREVVLLAMDDDWRAFRYASDGLRSTRSLALRAVKLNWANLEFVDERMQANRLVAVEAVRQNWRALDFVAKELLADRDLITKACEQDFRAIAFASQELRRDRRLYEETGILSSFAANIFAEVDRIEAESQQARRRVASGSEARVALLSQQLRAGTGR